MDKTSGNPAVPSLNHGNASTADRVARQLHLTRIFLQDPTSPAFGHPIRAAELAGLIPSPATSLSTNLFRDGHTLHQVVAQEAARKRMSLDKIRTRVSEGLDATQTTTVMDEAGNHHSVPVPDHSARLGWAQLAANMDCLLPGKTADEMARKLPHDALQFAADQQSLLNPDDLETKLKKLTPGEAFLVSNFMLTVDEYCKLTEQVVRAEKLGEGVEEQIAQETAARLRADLRKLLPRRDSLPDDEN